ncbi:MAG TPA: ATP-dependent Clp protease proteolytic subunit [Anaerolineales bacterium]|nr:ATP-dependent Clp protease proteolytic subunit [Anaerolineales bacterium]
MDFFSILWIFLIISSLQPVIRQRMLEAARRRILRELEVKRHSRVIALIHRQETLALLGFPLARYIDITDSEDILRAIKLTDSEIPIDLVLHTPGGLVLAAEQIAYALSRHHSKVTVFVPHYAMSGGTLIAMAADEIVMDDNAVLGPVDPQLGQSPAASVLRVLEQKDINEIDDQTLIMADIARKAISQVQATIRKVLESGRGMPAKQAKQLAQALSSGKWTHDYPITVEEARELGLTISTDMPEEVYKLMSLYPQTSQRRPSVEYIPSPYVPQPAGERKQS